MIFSHVLESYGSPKSSEVRAKYEILTCQYSKEALRHERATGMGALSASKILDRLGKEEALVPSIWPVEKANVLVVAERKGEDFFGRCRSCHRSPGFASHRS